MKTLTALTLNMAVAALGIAGIPAIPEPGKTMMGTIKLPTGTSVQPTSIVAVIKEADPSTKTVTLTLGNGIEVKQLNNNWYYILKLPFATSIVDGQMLDPVAPHQFEFTNSGRTYQRSGATASIAYIKVNNVKATMTSDSFNFPSTTGALAERGDVETVNLTVASAKGPPIVATGGASGITTTGATLAGLVNPSDSSTTWYFEYGITNAYGSRTANQSATGTNDVNVAVTLSNLAPNSLYNFRLVASNANGSVQGDNKTFSTQTPVPPSFGNTPVSQLVPLGTNVGFSASISGGLPAPALQWLKGTTTVGSGTVYSIGNVTTSHAGSYTVRATNSVHTETASADLGVMSTASTTIPVINNGTFTATLVAAGPGLTFQWSKDGFQLSDGGRISGATSSKLVITAMTSADDGAYTCLVTMGSLSRSSGVFTAKVTTTPVLDPVVIGPWAIGKTVTDRVTAQNIPTKFSISGLPSGVDLNTTTGELSGKPRQSGTFKLTVTASNVAGTSAPVKLDVIVGALTGKVVGTFNGLIRPDPLFSKDKGLDVTITVAGSGLATGKLILPTETLQFTAPLDAPEDNDPTCSALIRRASGKPSVTVTFAINRSTGELTGTFTDGAIPAPLPVLAYRHAYAQTEAIGYVGTNYKLSWGANGQIDGLPGGFGFASSMTIAKNGIVVIVGKLADGTKFTRSTTLGETGQIALHAVPYANKTGSINGWLTVNLDAAVPANNYVDGSLAWSKDPQPATPVTYNYSSGILYHEMTVVGGRYVRPASGAIVMALENVVKGSNNSFLRFEHAGVEFSDSYNAINDHSVRITTSHSTSIAPPNPSSLTLKVDPGTGAFSGGCVLKEVGPPAVSRSFTYYGQIIQTGNNWVARGYFLLRELPSTGTSTSRTPLNSGRVELLPGIP